MIGEKGNRGFYGPDGLEGNQGIDGPIGNQVNS